MDGAKNKMPKYKLNSLIGIVISIALFFVAVFVKKYSLISSILAPLSLLLGFFFMGYMINGQKKTGLKWALILAVISGILILIAYFLK
jgi:ABC-type thiamin/hydroxymethylpyrimidine transport system permease subunit